MSTETEPAKGTEGQMTLMDHLGELRDRLVKCVIAVVLGGTIAWLFYNQIYDFLLEPYERVADPGSGGLFVTDPLEGFTVRLKVAGYGGIAFAMPVILWQLWRFITPGLYDHEKKYAIPFVGSAVVLFAMGAGLAYWTLPKALEFLTNIGGDDLTEIFSPAKYFGLITYMMLAFGIGFEFPILLIFLQMAGILETDTLRKSRRYAVVGIVVLVAVITPSGDPYSLAVLSIPMYLFFEASILIGRLLERRRSKAEAKK
ncbi:twin-arginine translocase subunit TatC [soil metagenome]